MDKFLARRISSHLEKLATLYAAVMITGPRQTGKTALARHHFPKHKWILFDDALLADQANRDPKLFLQNYSPPFILDEIQKAPGIFPALKELIDRESPPHGSIILTGSQPLPLMDLVTESLAGRVGLLELLPMSPAELFDHPTREFSFEDWIISPPVGERFSWQTSPYEYLLRGGFPQMGLSYHSPEPTDASLRLRDYTQTYLAKDLRDLSAITDLGRFERFLRTLSSTSGKLLELSALGRAVDLPQGTAHDWLSLLEASMIFWAVPGYAANLGKRERKRSKGFLIDSGLVCNLMNIRTVDALPQNPLSGFILETAVANSLRSTLFMNATSKPPLFHWNYKNQHEVDLVVEYANRRLCPVVIKLTAEPKLAYCKGLYRFEEAYSEQVSVRCVISTNDQCFWMDKKTLHIPCSAL